MATFKTIGTLLFRIESDTKALRKGMTQTKNSINKLKKSFNVIAVAAAAAFSTQAITRFTKEIVNLAGELQGVGDAFERIATPGLLDDLKDATKNTVTNLDLMKRAVMAHNFQIPLEQLASLFAFATKRAQQTGESVDFLVNSIVIGIGRKSPLILDNLGISAVRLREELEDAGHSGSTVFQVAQAVGKIAQKEMEKAGDIITTTNVASAQLEATWGNTKIVLGEIAIEAFNLTENLGKLNDVLSNITEGDKIKNFTDFIGTLATKFTLLGLAIQFNKEQMQFLSGAWETFKTLPFVRMFASIDFGKRVITGPRRPDLKVEPFPVPPPPAPGRPAIPSRITGVTAIGAISPADVLKHLQTVASSVAENITASYKRIEDGNKNLTKSFLLTKKEGGEHIVGLQTTITEQMQLIEQATATMVMGLQSAFQSLVTGLAESFANLVTGTGNFFQELGLLIANIAKLIGGLMIAVGSAFIGSGIFAGFGIPMVAAGAGLIAAGQIASNLIGMADMGNISNSSRSSGSFTTQSIIVTGKIAGRDIAIASQRGQLSIDQNT